jgi:hypothetical protein
MGGRNLLQCGDPKPPGKVVVIFPVHETKDGSDIHVKWVVMDGGEAAPDVSPQYVWSNEVP